MPYWIYKKGCVGDTFQAYCGDKRFDLVSLCIQQKFSSLGSDIDIIIAGIPALFFSISQAINKINASRLATLQCRKTSENMNSSISFHLVTKRKPSVTQHAVYILYLLVLHIVLQIHRHFSGRGDNNRHPVTQWLSCYMCTLLPTSLSNPWMLFCTCCMIEDANANKLYLDKIILTGSRCHTSPSEYFGGSPLCATIVGVHSKSHQA